MGRAVSGADRKKDKSHLVKKLSTFCRHERLKIYVAIESRLAAQYVLQLLAKDKNIKIAAMQELLTEPSPRKVAPIFVLDDFGFALPLGQCLTRLKSKYPGARFLLLGPGKSPSEIAQLLSTGIHGFVSYEQVNDSLLAAIRSIAEGRLWMGSSILRPNFQPSTKLPNARNKTRSVDAMTQRETEIIELAKRRLSNKEIAALLKIQESTVKFHLSNIFSKLQITCRSDLLDKAPGDELWRKMLAS